MTAENLCIVPGCRIRGRHLPACEDEKCGGCLPRQAEDGYCCGRCASLAPQNLELVAEVALAVSDAANRLSAGSGGGGPGKPGSQLPLNLGARSRLDSVEGTVFGWARHVAEERGVRLPELPEPVAPPIGPLCRARYECTHPSCKAMRDPERTPPMLAVVARWLTRHLDWFAHRPEVGEVFADLAACARVLSSVVRAPSEQRYLGPCGAETEAGQHCNGDVYGRPDAEYGRCKTCKAQWDAEARRKWLDEERRAWAFRAFEIAQEYRISVNTIRSWAGRGHLKSYWRTDGGLVIPWTEMAEEASAERLHYVGDVLDLAAADAARRAEEQAKRARRAAAREAAGSETAA